MRHLTEQGVEYVNVARDRRGVQVRPDGITQIYFQDPDGHWVEINDAGREP
jgi:lactoylglutathione lyase